MSGQTRAKRGTPPPKISLNPENFHRLVEDHGSYCRVTPSIVCPRRSGTRIELDDTNHDLNCPLCFGSQTIDLHDISFETWTFIQGVKIEKLLNTNGIFDVKDSFASFQPGVRVSYWYKIELLDFATQYNEVLFRSTSSNTDKLRFPAVDCSDGNIFSIIDNDGNRFVRDEDYEIESGTNVVVWGSKRSPVAGKLYSMLYPVLPTFRVLDLMHEQRNYYRDEKSAVKTPVQMPQQAHIRWDFAARKQGSDRKISDYS